MIKKVSDKIEVIGDPLSSFILLKYDKIDELIENLKKNGFYVAKQCHLIEDWCQNEYIKVNLGTWLTNDKIKLLADIITNIKIFI